MKVSYIAEIGNNHHGDIKLAEEMADAAIDAGADFVKFQTYRVDEFIHRGNSYFSEFASDALDFDDFARLKHRVEKSKAGFLATPFDKESFLMLDQLGLETIKISSGDLTNPQLLSLAVEMKKKLIISTGGATEDEIIRTVDFLRRHALDFTMLHCTLDYPASFTDLNLNYLRTMRDICQCPVGYSDHTLGIEASLAAIALGATVIEKHFTVDKSLPGGDNEMSILPEQLSRLINEGNHISQALGSESRIIVDNEIKLLGLVRRKCFARGMIRAGSSISENDVVLLRPDGVSNAFDMEEYYSLIGGKARTNIATGAALSSENVDPHN